MNNRTDSMLRVVDHASSKLGPLSALLDKFVEKVVPATTAAACGGSRCQLNCTSARCGHGFGGYYYWSTAPRGCEQGIYTCTQYGCFC